MADSIPLDPNDIPLSPESMEALRIMAEGKPKTIEHIHYSLTDEPAAGDPAAADIEAQTLFPNSPKLWGKRGGVEGYAKAEHSPGIKDTYTTRELFPNSPKLYLTENDIAARDPLAPSDDLYPSSPSMTGEHRDNRRAALAIAAQTYDQPRSTSDRYPRTGVLPDRPSILPSPRGISRQIETNNAHADLMAKRRRQ
jgi:hypothetical protein